jgi:hypothetical protein
MKDASNGWGRAAVTVFEAEMAAVWDLWEAARWQWQPAFAETSCARQH